MLRGQFDIANAAILLGRGMLHAFDRVQFRSCCCCTDTNKSIGLYVQKHINLDLRLHLQSVCAYVSHKFEKVTFGVKVVQKNLFEITICCHVFAEPSSPLLT